MDMTPLPDALNVQPVKQNDSMIQILQKEWQNVINKSLFEFPTIKESTIASQMSTIDDVVPEIKKNDIGLTKG
jgi:hypothetical protein